MNTPTPRFTCCNCGANPRYQPARVLHRISPLGELPALWHCDQCLTAPQRDALDPEVTALVDVIRSDNAKTKSPLWSLSDLDRLIPPP